MPASEAMGRRSIRPAKSRTPNGHEEAREDVGPTGACARADHQSRARDRAAQRNALKETGCSIGQALPSEVAIGFGILAVRVGVGLADAGRLYQADNADGNSGQQQCRDVG